MSDFVVHCGSQLVNVSPKTRAVVGAFIEEAVGAKLADEKRIVNR